MQDETRLTLHEVDQLRTDIANVESALEPIMSRLARLPARNDLVRVTLTAVTHDLIGVVVFTLSRLNRVHGGRRHSRQAILDRSNRHRPRARALGTIGWRHRSVHLPHTRATPGGGSA